VNEYEYWLIECFSISYLVSKKNVNKLGQKNTLISKKKAYPSFLVVIIMIISLVIMIIQLQSCLSETAIFSSEAIITNTSAINTVSSSHTTSWAN